MTRMMDNIGSVVPDELDIAVSLGKLPHWSSVSTWNENDSVNTVQEEMSNVDGVRVLPTSGSAITIASSNAADAAAGTGARTVQINYLDTSFVQQSVVLTMNGTSNVLSTPTDAYRFMSAAVLTVGSNLAPVGNLTISIDGNAQAIINAGQNESRETGLTVPAGKVFLSSAATIATGRAGNVDVDIAFEVRYNGSDVWYTTRSLQNYQQTTAFNVIGVAVLPAGTDLRVLCTATGGSGPSAYVQVRGYFIDNIFFDR